MALDTYTNLQAAVANWMHRKNLTGDIPDFITLAETRIKALLEMRLQNTNGTVNTVLGVATAAAPIGLINIRSMSIPNVRPTIKYVTPDQFAIDFADGRSASPYSYTLIGGQLYFGPVPDAAYAVAVTYEAEFVPLSDTQQTNIVLTKWPNVYLWGALKEAANFARDASYEATCESNFLSAIESANRLEWSSAGPMRMRVDTYTP
jgi:hypothetical protein